MADGPKTLFLDIETAPSLAYIWGLWQEVRSADMVDRDWYILCWCAKWLGKRGMISASLPEGGDYKTTDDGAIMRRLWPLLDEADVVCGHNAKRFDCRKINARFLVHRLPPPSPYKIVDTLLMARAGFSFTSARLNDLATALDLGKKKATGGFELWRRCMRGDPTAWSKMVQYCAQDVRLLERVYHALLPYSTRMPNPGAWTGERCCSKCGSTRVIKKGWAHTNASSFQKYLCKDCSSWTRGRKRIVAAPLSGVAS